MAFTRRDYVALGDGFKKSLVDGDLTEAEYKAVLDVLENVCVEVAKVNSNFNRERLHKQIFGKPTHKVDPANRPSPLLMATKKPTTP